MGNESSLVKDCKLELEVAIPTPRPWRLYHARRKDGTRISVFVYEPEKQHSVYIENAAKYLKVLRHPSITKFEGLERVADGAWLATEQVTPLESLLDHMTSAEIVAGIYSILEALVFLHDRGGLCHNNLNLSSVFVAEDGSWKLGGLEYLCRFDQATTSYLNKCKNLRFEDALSPEEKAGKVDSSQPGWARDAYAFGLLVELLMENVTDLGDLTKIFDLRIQDECLDPDPNRRPKLSTFLQDRIFKNEFLQMTNFLKNITLHTEDEKKKFFWNLIEDLHNIPVEIVATRLVRPLLSRFVLLDSTACDRLLPHLLQPYTGSDRSEFSPEGINPLLPEDLFRRHVVPELFKIFHVRDVHIRSVLLLNFDRYVDQFDREMLGHVILPQILLGVRDTNDDLVQLSLHAIAHLVPILGGDTVVGPNRLKLFVEAAPKFSDKPHQGKHPDAANGIIQHDASPKSMNTTDSAPCAALTEEKERRKAEAKKRNEDRRRKRQEAVQERKHGVTEMITESIPVVPSVPVQMGSDDDDDTFEPMQSPVSLEKVSRNNISQQKSQPHGMSLRGALQLKSSKMRTSPPPPNNITVEIMEDISTSNQISTEVKGHRRDNSLIADDAETWAAGGEDDNWNSDNWQDIGDDETITKDTNSSPIHNQAVPHRGSSPTSPKITMEAKKGVVNGKNKSPGLNRVINKPRVVDLDIMSLDIKTSSTAPSGDSSFDFFADMQPEIKQVNKGLWGVLSDNRGNSEGHDAKIKDLDSKKETTSLTFAVQANTEEVGDGWGDDDLAWDEEPS